MTSAMAILYTAHQQQWQEAQRFCKNWSYSKTALMAMLYAQGIRLLLLDIESGFSSQCIQSSVLLSTWCARSVCIVCSGQMCVCVCFSLSTHFLSYLVWDIPPLPSGVGSSPQFLHWNLHTSSCGTFSHLAISLPICCFLTQQCKGYAICGNWISL